jgi:tetratricopeptide (TPR) repeat protein
MGHLASIGGTPFHDFHRSWTSSDMHANRVWAERLASGDWLDRDAYRPRFDWMDAVADEATWNRWLGPATYYQPPLYPYLLAVGLKLLGSADAFRWLQVLLGAANAALVGLLGRRVAGPGAGLAGAALAAAYAPFILYDAELLRGTVVLAFDLLALIALHAAGAAEAAAGGVPRDVAARRRAAARGWIAAGAALGGAYLADSGIVFFLPAAALWAAAGGPAFRGRPEARPALARAGLLGAGFLAAILPLAARNLAVGAPLVSTTTRAPLAFVMGNAPGAHAVGAAIPEAASGILHASDYGVARTLLETIRAHGGDVGAILGLQLLKLGGLFNSYEVPDNPSFYYAALRSPVLRYGLRFACVAGLGLAGLLLAARRPKDHMLMYLFLAGVLSLFLCAHVVSRYRQPLLVPLLVYAGHALAEAARAARAGRRLAAAGILAGGAAVSLALPADPPPGYRYYRPAEFMVAAGMLEAEGDVGRAAAELKLALAKADADRAPSSDRVLLGLALGDLYRRHQRFPEALSAFRDVVEEDPRNPDALAAMGAIHHDTHKPIEALETLLRAEMADPSNPEVQARLGHLYWFTFKDGAQALPHLRRALEMAPNSAAAPRLSALVAEIDAAGAAP